jgi:hypothetical protein
MDRTSYPTAKHRLGTEARAGSVDAYSHLSPTERLELVWQLTVQAWAFLDPAASERRLRRDIGRVIRGGG